MIPRPFALLLTIATLLPLHAQTTSFRYFYDDANELFRVLDSTGTLIQYDYDPAGNIIQIQRTTIAPTALTILNITPLSGIVGSTLTIYGQNFSPIAANNIVQINGVTVTVLSATTGQLTIEIPYGLTAGQIAVTVNGVTVASGPSLVYTPVPPSGISAVSPASAAGGQNVTLTITGTNLLNAAFYFANGLGIVTSATIRGDGSGATLQASLASAAGIDNITAVNYLGTSVAATGNQFTVLAPGVPTHGSALSSPAITALNDISQPGKNLAASPTISALNDVSQPGKNLAAAPTISALNDISQPGGNFASELLTVLNTITAPGGAAAMSRWVSVMNTNTSGHAVSSATGPPTTKPAVPVSNPVLSLANAVTKVVPGQTVTLTIAAGNSGSPALLLNGAPVDDPATPGIRRFLIPSGIPTIKALVRDGAAESDPLELTVAPPAPRRLSGRLLLPEGAPATGRDMEIRSTGLTAEYFEWKTPLTALPDFTGLTPDRTAAVSSLAMENPAGVFGADPFGTGLPPNYAARFTGAIHVDTEGDHRFVLTAHAGASLLIDGKVVAEAQPLNLTPGWHAIEVDHFENGGAPELRLEWERPGFPRETVDPAHFTPARFWTARTDERGYFVIPDFPAFLDPLEFRAVCDGQCSIVMEQNQ